MEKTIASRALVRGAFEQAGLDRVPFLPWVFTHAARLEQVPVRRMYADPTQYVKCLQNARKLYGYDGIATGFDTSLVAELAGCPVTWDSDDAFPTAGPLPDFDPGQLAEIDVEKAAATGRFGTVTESLRRIKIVSGASLALAAVIPGPLTLAAVMKGGNPAETIGQDPGESMALAEAAATLLLKVVKVLCRYEPDILVVADPLISLLPASQLSRLEPVLSPLVNTVRFYNAFSVLVPGETSSEKLADIIGLGFDSIVTPGIDVETWRQAQDGRSCVLGLAIPSGTLTKDGKAVADYLWQWLPAGPVPGMFLTTDGEVPPDTPPESLRAVMEIVSGR